MLDEAEGKLDVFQQNVATWFDGAMDRTSGAYKRWIHRLTFWAGFAVAIAFNVNSLQLIDNLWRDPVARAGLVAQASVTAQSADTAQGVQAQLTAPSRRPPGIRPPPPSDAEGAAPECACDGEQNAADLAQNLPLPIGWSQQGDLRLWSTSRCRLPPSKRTGRQDLSNALPQRLERDGEDLPDPAGPGDHRPGRLAGLAVLVRHPAVGDQHPRDGRQAGSRGRDGAEVGESFSPCGRSCVAKRMSGSHPT
jgi:hypothetical protein